MEAFISKFFVIPVYNSLDIYAKEKARLRKQGLLIDNFDILIGATAVTNDMIMVTYNVAHLSRLDNTCKKIALHTTVDLAKAEIDEHGLKRK